MKKGQKLLYRDKKMNLDCFYEMLKITSELENPGKKANFSVQ